MFVCFSCRPTAFCFPFSVIGNLQHSPPPPYEEKAEAPPIPEKS